LDDDGAGGAEQCFGAAIEAILVEPSDPSAGKRSIQFGGEELIDDTVEVARQRSDLNRDRGILATASTANCSVAGTKGKDPRRRGLEIRIVH
jgi:hypothetical protein